MVIGTPKAINKITEEHRKQFPPVYELLVTPYVYMNMMDGWTEEECDNVLYIVDLDALGQPFRLTPAG